MAKYICNVCGVEFEVNEGEPLVCPVCGADGEALEKAE